jgi:hypothetical protein
MSHTPGPRLVYEFDEAQVCVLGPEYEGGKRDLVGVFTGEHRLDNATLDAAAPELLEALRRLLLLDPQCAYGVVHCGECATCLAHAVVAKCDPSWQ